MTRDTYGWACKGSWFEVKEIFEDTADSDITGQSTPVVRTYKKAYNIYKDPITDDGTKKSLKGLCAVEEVNSRNNFDKVMTKDTRFPIKEYVVKTECTPEEEESGLLQLIYQDGKFYNSCTLTEIREKINSIV